MGNAFFEQAARSLPPNGKSPTPNNLRSFSFLTDYEKATKMAAS